MKHKRFVFGVVSYVMTHYSAISPNGGTSRRGNRDNFKGKPRTSSPSF